jgi:hypothetical protein
LEQVDHGSAWVNSEGSGKNLDRFADIEELPIMQDYNGMAHKAPGNSAT